MRIWDYPLPEVGDETTRALIGELREEINHGINFSRVVNGLAEGEKAFLRRVARTARDLRTPRPQATEEGLTFGRRGRL